MRIKTIDKKSHLFVAKKSNVMNAVSLFFLGMFTWNVFFLMEVSAQPIAGGKDKFLGCAMSAPESRFANYWNQVTPGNAGKWGSVEFSQDSYNWAPLDNIYNFAKEKGILYKHHTLIWGQQQPNWINNLDSATQRSQIEEWIQLVGERYPDMDFVDVVNEPLHAPPAYMQGLGGSGETGWDWVITSFELARQYCPNAKLILNDYNILHNNSSTTNYLTIINLLKDRGLIDGIGIQGHYLEYKGSGYTYSVTTIKNNLNRLVDTEIPVYITEFDINEADDEVQLQNYQTYFPIFWENPGVKGMTLWGYLLDDVWLPNAYLLDERFKPRPAMEWLQNYMKSSPRPELIYPAAAATGVERNPMLIWSSSESATSYHVQISANSIFTIIIRDTTVTDTSLQVEPLSSGTHYYWRVSAVNEFIESSFADAIYFTTGDEIVDREEEIVLPGDFVLYQNYPNPFNPTTQIMYSIPVNGYISLKVYNLLGEEVATLYQGMQQVGNHVVTFDASELVSGIYIYQLRADNFTETKKLMLLK